jgi:hypothetical protein
MVMDDFWALAFMVLYTVFVAALLLWFRDKNREWLRKARGQMKKGLI